MKIRMDFVTNSSSSSFIIGKVDEDISVESVYQMIRGYYIEYKDIFFSLANECDKYGLRLKEKEGYYSFEFKEGKHFDKKNQKMDDKIVKKYGISSWEVFDKSILDWTACDTYKEYEKYWLNKMSESDRYVHAPFSISDLTSDGKHYDLTYGRDGVNNVFPNIQIGSDSSLLDWYLPCLHDYFYNKENYENSCKYCFDKDYCSFNKDVEKLVKEKGLTDENVVSIMLGKILVESECGYIPDMIVDKLGAKSNYFCNHMG